MFSEKYMMTTIGKKFEKNIYAEFHSKKKKADMKGFWVKICSDQGLNDFADGQLGARLSEGLYFRLKKHINKVK